MISIKKLNNWIEKNKIEYDYRMLIYGDVFIMQCENEFNEIIFQFTDSENIIIKNLVDSETGYHARF